MIIDCKFTPKTLTPVLLQCWWVLCFGCTYALKAAPVAALEYHVIHFNAPIVDSVPVDSIKRDSLKTIAARKKNKDSLDAPVNYHADDSIKYDIANGKIYLYGKGHVDYKDISLDAAYIVFDWKNNMVHAQGTKDTTGKIIGKPVFKDGSENYKADTINFNFKSKKGRISEGLTEEGGGYVHSDVVKKASDKIYFAKNAYYTTCDLDDPHFYIVASRAEIIPGKLLVTGPADLVIEGIPTPLFVPFGIFPLSDGQHSGIIVPSYGYSSSYGYYLQNVGYYFALGQHLDLKLLGDLYTSGGWQANVISDYAQRYEYSGTFNFALANTVSGDKEEGTYQSSQNYDLLWSFNQDPKARPYSRFTINIDAASSQYDKIYTYDPNTTLSSELSSSVSYNKTFQGTPFSLTANLSQNQNLQTGVANLTLPSIDFDMNTIYPFASANQSAKQTWINKISIGYTFTSENILNTYDSLLFKNFNLNQLQWSALQDIPISTSFKAFKYFTISPSADYQEFWYDQSIRENWNGTQVVTDTVHGFATGRDFTTSLSATTTIYGLVNFKHGKIKAIRHVLTPSLSFSYHPDFTKFGNDFYRTVQADSAGDKQSYSIFQNGNYGGPPEGKYGGFGLTLGNNLEMKVYSKKDTVNHSKKITLLNNLTVSTFYNLASDTDQWSPVTLNGNTSLFNVINMNFSAMWDEYTSDSLGNRTIYYEWNVDHKLLRLTNAALSFSTSLKSIQDGKTNPGATPHVIAGNQIIYYQPDDFTDFKVPYNLGIGYTLNLAHAKGLTGLDTTEYTQTLTFNGSLNLTPLWKLTASSGYDFVQRQLSYTLVSITRDLHCWYMSFTWVPVGYNRSYFLTLGVKSGVLQQLKLPVLHSPNTSNYVGSGQ
jgi:hypothetical protein